MIPILKIFDVSKIRDDMWIVWMENTEGLLTPRLVPAIDPPRSCPGGRQWCQYFGCDKIQYVEGR